MTGRSLVRAHNIVTSVDGFSTGEDQSRLAAFGSAQSEFMDWFSRVRVFRGQWPAFVSGADEAMAATWGYGIGAEIMGRHKFDPSDGPWPDDDWIGWWGTNPPYHTPCYVLTHYPRPSIELEGGNVFHFVAGTPAEVLARVRADIGDELDIRLGGGVQTLRDYVRAGVVDVLHVIVIPVVLGRGERLWDGLEGLHEAFDVESVSTPSGVTHVTFTRRVGEATEDRPAK